MPKKRLRFSGFTHAQNDNFYNKLENPYLMLNGATNAVRKKSDEEVW
jgi:hypothetical protein